MCYPRANYEFWWRRGGGEFLIVLNNPPPSKKKLNSLKAAYFHCLNFRGEYPLKLYIIHCQTNHLKSMSNVFYYLFEATLVRPLNYFFTYTVIEVVWECFTRGGILSEGILERGYHNHVGHPTGMSYLYITTSSCDNWVKRMANSRPQAPM